MISVKNEKGITIVSLIFTIILLIILTTITKITIDGTKKDNAYNKMVADINVLEDKILVYYNKNGEVPIQDITELIDGVNYYKIDLGKLENITLNFGKNEDINDYYLVNDNLKVYYKEGIEKSGVLYHTID